MSEANKAIVRRWFEEVWNQGREETIDELFAEHAVGYGLGDTDVTTRGPAEFKIFANNLRGALRFRGLGNSEKSLVAGSCATTGSVSANLARFPQAPRR